MATRVEGKQDYQLPTAATESTGEVASSKPILTVSISAGEVDAKSTVFSINAFRFGNRRSNGTYGPVPIRLPSLSLATMGVEETKDSMAGMKIENQDEANVEKERAKSLAKGTRVVLGYSPALGFAKGKIGRVVNVLERSGEYWVKVKLEDDNKEITVRIRDIQRMDTPKGARGASRAVNPFDDPNNFSEVKVETPKSEEKLTQILTPHGKFRESPKYVGGFNFQAASPLEQYELQVSPGGVFAGTPSPKLPTDYKKISSRNPGKKNTYSSSSHSLFASSPTYTETFDGLSNVPQTPVAGTLTSTGSVLEEIGFRDASEDTKRKPKKKVRFNLPEKTKKRASRIFQAWKTNRNGYVAVRDLPDEITEAVTLKYGESVENVDEEKFIAALEASFEMRASDALEEGESTEEALQLIEASLEEMEIGRPLTEDEKQSAAYVFASLDQAGTGRIQLTDLSQIDRDGKLTKLAEATAADAGEGITLEEFYETLEGIKGGYGEESQPLWHAFMSTVESSLPLSQAEIASSKTLYASAGGEENKGILRPSCESFVKENKLRGLYLETADDEFTTLEEFQAFMKSIKQKHGQKSLQQFIKKMGALLPAQASHRRSVVLQEQRKQQAAEEQKRLEEEREKITMQATQLAKEQELAAELQEAAGRREEEHREAMNKVLQEAQRVKEERERILEAEKRIEDQRKQMEKERAEMEENRKKLAEDARLAEKERQAWKEHEAAKPATDEKHEQGGAGDGGAKLPFPHLMRQGITYVRIFRYGGKRHAGENGLQGALDVPLSVICSLAASASRVHIRDPTNPKRWATSRPLAYPVERLAAGRSLNLTAAGDPATLSDIAKAWEAPIEVLPALVCEKKRGAEAAAATSLDHDLSVCVYDPGDNPLGLRMFRVKKEGAEWTGWGPQGNGGLEVFINLPTSFDNTPSERSKNVNPVRLKMLQTLGFPASQATSALLLAQGNIKESIKLLRAPLGLHSASGLPPYSSMSYSSMSTVQPPPILPESLRRNKSPAGKSQVSLKRVLSRWERNNVRMYTRAEYMQVKMLEALGQIPYMSFAQFNSHLAQAKRHAKDNCGPMLWEGKYAEVHKASCEFLRDLKERRSKLRDYRRQTVESCLVTWKMKTLLMQTLNMKEDLTAEELEEEMDEVRQKAKEDLHPAILPPRVQQLIQLTKRLLKASRKRRERLDMIISAYKLPLRFKLGDKVRVFIHEVNNWKEGSIAACWEQGYPYKVRLAGEPFTEMFVFDDTPEDIIESALGTELRPSSSRSRAASARHRQPHLGVQQEEEYHSRPYSSRYQDRDMVRERTSRHRGYSLHSPRPGTAKSSHSRRPQEQHRPTSSRRNTQVLASSPNLQTEAHTSDYFANDGKRSRRHPQAVRRMHGSELLSIRDDNMMENGSYSANSFEVPDGDDDDDLADLRLPEDAPEDPGKDYKSEFSFDRRGHAVFGKQNGGYSS